MQRPIMEFRNAVNEMVIRQSSAHPMSEFLGTCIIVIVLLFGGSLILSNTYSPDGCSHFYFLFSYSL